MYSFLILIASIISVFLMILVLLQSSKGGGLAGGTFGGGAGNMGSMFGTRRTADFLSKATWWLGGGLMVLSVVVNLFFLPGQSTKAQRESIIQSSGQNAIPQQPALPKPNTIPTETNKVPKTK